MITGEQVSGVLLGGNQFVSSLMGKDAARTRRELFFLLPMLKHDGIFLRKDSLAIKCQADVIISLFLLKANHH